MWHKTAKRIILDKENNIKGNISFQHLKFFKRLEADNLFPDTLSTKIIFT